MKGFVVDKHERRLDKELDSLKNKLLRMAAFAETMIDKTISELVERDDQIGTQVPEYEEEINRLQIDIDEEAIMILATQQPVAGDLRFIITASKINSELERIGDLTINIRENVRTLLEEPPLKPLIDIPRMAELARQMVRDSLDSLVKEDVLLAQSVISADDQVDGLKS